MAGNVHYGKSRARNPYHKGKIESIQKCNLIDPKALQKKEEETSNKVSSIGKLEEKITPPVHKRTVTEMVKQNRGLFAEKNTDLDKIKP